METRLEQARRRAGTAKRALVGVAAAGLVAVVGLARVSHPGHAAQPASTPSSSVIAPAYDESQDDGGYDVQTPQAMTHVS